MKTIDNKEVLAALLKIAYVILVIICLIILGAFAYAYADEGKMDEVEKEFTSADIINEGKLDKGEFDIYHYNAFQLLDTNKNSHISKDECVSNCFTDKSKTQKMDNVRYEFNNIDIDGSGLIQVYEFILHGREKFRSHDINGDNFIDKNEFCSFYQATMPCSFIIAEEGKL